MVGADAQVFYVHQSLLCQNSPFFEAANKEEWKEGKDHCVPFPDDSPATVAVYVHWLYTGKIYTRSLEEDEQASNSKEARLLIDSFVLGDKLQDGHFKDAVLDGFIVMVGTPVKSGTQMYPGDSLINRTYENTPEGSPLRRLLVDMYFYHGTKDWANDNMNVSFLADLTCELLGTRPRGSQWDTTKVGGNSCIYHYHKAPEICYTARK